MAIGASGRLTTPHDWHSDQYVADWIVHDTARDPERRPRLQAMLAAATFARDAEFAVLDVGAGYGAVTEEVLKAFPRARVTLQDYSQPMLAEAHRRLAGQAAQLRYVTSDLTGAGGSSTTTCSSRGSRDTSPKCARPGSRSNARGRSRRARSSSPAAPTIKARLH
jgi:SAM-dependent methyltransferase